MLENCEKLRYLKKFIVNSMNGTLIGQGKITRGIRMQFILFI